ncbi:MAG: FISUMP domain-containing protein, partial [Bacteroidota bacterium]
MITKKGFEGRDSHAEYNGEFKDGAPEGDGILMLRYPEPDSSEDKVIVYKGQFSNGLRNGMGKEYIRIPTQLSFTSVYDGEWLKGKKNGKGKITESNEYDSWNFDGTWQDDKKNGYFEYNGRYVDLNNIDHPVMASFKGFYSNDMRNGEGIEVYGGETYVGTWKDDKNYGFGKMIYKDGRVYEGEWLDNLPSGQGQLTLANKTIQKGKFVAGEFKKTFECKQVTIGNQIWMADNLNTSKFRNGDVIPEAKTNADWESAGYNKQPAWCYYKNDPVNGQKYGKLYNWHAVHDPRGLAPEGWHIPSAKEFKILIVNLGENENSFGSIAAPKLKTKTGWDKFSGNGNNESGF